jgi:3',5'-cyclic-AMP phosphodiesterase
MLVSCDKFDYSPYEIRVPEHMRNLTNKNVNKILSRNISPNDTLRFVITSDTQGFYAHNDALVSHINQNQKVEFVLHNGDITDFGLLREHEWIYESFSKLKVPFVTVIGNHDATGNGQALYKLMYGDFDHSFVTANRKFIFLNTNNWEFKGEAPDLEWLENELIGSEQYLQTFVFTHIPPNTEAFGEDKIAKYKELVNKYKVSISIHGHGHGYNFFRPTESDVYELHVASTQAREYIVMEVYQKDVSFKRVSF